MQFNTAYNHLSGKAEPECPKVIKDYIYNKELDCIEESGTTPFYERIQSYADSTRLDKKLEQFRLGNTLALGVPSGEYGDFSTQPSSLEEVLQARDNAKQQFESLPEGIRRLFSNSYSEFAKSLQDGTYSAKLQQYAIDELKKLGNVAAAPGSQNPGTENPTT